MKDRFFDSPLVKISGLVVAGATLYLIIRYAVPAVCIAVGAAFGIVGGSVGLTGVIGPTMVKVGTLGAAAGGVGLGIRLIQVTVHVAERRPFWTLAPVLGVASAFAVDISKELYPGQGVMKALLGAAVGLLIVGGGILWRRPGWLPKVGASACFLAGPLLVGFRAVTHTNEGLLASLQAVDTTTWLAASLVLLFGLVTAILAANTPAT